MQRYVVPPSLWDANTLTVTGQDAFHAHTVMRLTKGDRFTAIDNLGRIALCEAVQVAKDRLVGSILSQTVEEKKPPFIVVGQALIRKDAFETVLEKATELGAWGIQPLNFRHCVVRFDKADETKKRSRYEAILKEAAEQSERAFLPVLREVCDLKDIHPSEYGTILIAHAREANDHHLSSIVAKIDWEKPILVVIGPEGGIQDDELTLLESLGGIRVSLGRYILRSETASAYLLSALHALFEVFA
jgi:16S rRNA (uracil1498-N3)-methyltransferase